MEEKTAVLTRAAGGSTRQAAPATPRGRPPFDPDDPLARTVPVAPFPWWGPLMLAGAPALWVFFTSGTLPALLVMLCTAAAVSAATRVANRPAARDADPFARFCAGEVLNVVATGVLAVSAPLLWTFVWSGAGRGTSPFLFVATDLMSLPVLASLLAALGAGALRASRGAWYRAPFTVPVFRAHRRGRP